MSRTRRLVLVAAGATALVVAALAASWFLWPDAFFVVLILSPLAILVLGMLAQMAGVLLPREHPRPKEKP